MPPRHMNSHFLPYSDPLQYQLPFEREGKTILPKPFSYDNVSINFFDSSSEAEDKVESFYGIEDEVQSNLDLDPIRTPNPMPKWAQNIIDTVGNMTGESSHMRRTRS